MVLDWIFTKLRELEKVVSEHLDDAGQSAVLHGIHKRITAISFNQDEIVFLPLQGDWVQCEVAVYKLDVITVHFQRHFLI